MVMIKLLKNTVKHKKGEIGNWSKGSAEHMVAQGYAEYITKPNAKKLNILTPTTIKKAKLSL